MNNKKLNIGKTRAVYSMTDTKRKLIDLVSALEEENIVDYCYTFIGLKVYGKTKLPESIIAELGQLWENRMLPNKELTAEKQEVQRYRCELVRIIYDIGNVATLNYIYKIVEDVYKEAKGGVEV